MTQRRYFILYCLSNINFLLFLNNITPNLHNATIFSVKNIIFLRFTRAAIVTQGEGRCCCTLSVHAGNGSVAGMGRVCLCQQQLHCGVHMYTRASRKEKVRSAYMHACLQSDVGVGRW